MKLPRLLGGHLDRKERLRSVRDTKISRGANNTQASNERASHVQLLFANIDGGAPVPPPLHVALCTFLPRQSTAPYMRGAAPRVFGKAPPKDLHAEYHSTRAQRHSPAPAKPNAPSRGR